MIPVGIRVWNEISKGIEWWIKLAELFFRILTGSHRQSAWLRDWLDDLLHRLGRWGCLLDLLAVQRADLELLLVFLQNTLIVVFPERLGGILALESLED